MIHNASMNLFRLMDHSLHRKHCFLQLTKAQSLYYPQVLIQHRPICCTQFLNGIATQNTAEEGNIIKRAFKKIKFYTVDKSRLKMIGYYLYECVADEIPYLWYFKEMSLPDTFNSWFLVTELHVWMLMVKAMELGKDGRVIRNFIVEAMWSDVMMKTKKLGAEHYSMAREQTRILGDQFQAALISYDEGLLGDDKVLASALWRRFFEMKCSDAKQLETMVKYVRMQMNHLDSISEDDFRVRNIKWIQIENM